MPRVTRFVVQGCFYHITQRGNNQRIVFKDDVDFRKYLHLLEEYRVKFNVEIFAYCLMPNHIHLVLRIGEAGFANFLKMIHMRYVQFFNLRYESSGHLWQGRFYSCLLEESHLYRAVRYVERNPVRAGLIEWSGDWIWSSSREHMEIDKGIVFLKRIKDYINVINWQKYLDEQESPDDLLGIRRETKSGRIFGSSEFIQSLEKKYGIEVAKPTMGRPKK